MNNENTYSSSFIAKRFYINEALLPELGEKELFTDLTLTPNEDKS